MGFITVAGENQIAAKQGGGQTLNITSFVLANIDGLDPNNEPANRIEAMPSPSDIMDTRAVTSSGYVNTNQVVYSLVLDSSIGDYDFNWVGLVDDEGVLIAATYTPLIQKRATAGAVPGNNLTRNFLIAFSGIQATTAIAVPAETWQIDFNARLHGIDERERLSNYDVYGHEGFFADGWKVVRQAATTTYDVLEGIGYVGGIRIASAANQQITIDTPPASVWLDVSLQGDISDVSPVVDFIIDAVAHSDYTDANGFEHYVTKIAEIAADGSATDVRTASPLDIVPQATAEAGIDTSVWTWTAQRVRQAIDAVVKAASETMAGIAEVATQAETDAGTDDARIVTPKKLRWGFSSLFAVNGYIVFPSWLGRPILQWGVITVSGGGFTTFNHPVAFTTSLYAKTAVWSSSVYSSTAKAGIVTQQSTLSSTGFGVTDATGSFSLTVLLLGK